MEKRLGYSVLRNFDYSQPFEEGVVNRGREERQSSHILSKTCLDLFLPSSGDSVVALNNKTASNGLIKETKEETYGAESTSVRSSLEESVKRRNKNGERGEGPRPPPPLVVFAYGGGWRRGDKQTWRHYISRWECNFSLAAMVGCDRLYSNIGESFASRGFSSAVLSYPIAPTPSLINLIEMAISLSYALAYYILAALFLFFILEVFLKGFGQLDSHSLRVPALSLMAGVIIVAQWITLAIMISRELYLERKHQSDTKKTMSRKMPIFIALVAIIATVSKLDLYALAENSTLALAISGILFFAVQCLIYYFRQTTTFDLGSSLVAGPQGQAESVALALRWLVDYGRSTGHFDTESIILVGHSAGGHLVSLVALDHHYLTDVGISPQVIKGVITLSAVHDLQAISKGFFYHIYLKPAFGTDPAFWTSMSPIEYIKLLDESENSTTNSTQSSSSSSQVPNSSSSSLSSAAAASSSSSSSKTSTPPQTTFSSTSMLSLKSSSSSPSQPAVASPSSLITKTPSAPHRPHFLIISPAQDFQFMIKDADKMYSILNKNGYVTERILMKGCSHFNMVRKFGCPWYRYWTGVLRRRGGWVPTDGELICWEFVQKFWNKE